MHAPNVAFFSYICTTHTHTYVVQQPSAEQSVCAGQTATLSIITGGTGAPLKYEWQFSPDLTSGWLAITEPRFEGASSPQLTVQKVQSSDGGHYRCVVHQQARNQQSLISDTVKLTVGECGSPDPPSWAHHGSECSHILSAFI